MTTPGSSGKAGPTPIPGEGTPTLATEQVRPSFRFGMHELSLGDQVEGIHRLKKIHVVGTVIYLAGCLCLSTDEGVFPITRIAIASVQPPLFE